MSLALALSLAPASQAFAAEETADPIGSFFSGIAQFFGLGGEEDGIDAQAVEGELTVADASSFDSWRQYLTSNGQYSTENVGRIWTDKTVSDEDITFTQGALAEQSVNKGSSDFLVALSALSSTSNLVVQGANTPLDIVLVLDVSGSMADELSSSYVETYSVTANGTYYVLDGGEYYKLDRRQNNWRYWKGQNYISVTPKTSADDTNASHVQFYAKKTESKIAALQSAVDSFIAKTAEQNSGISDASQQHRIALVKFAGTKSNTVGNDTYRNGSYTYNYSQIVSDFSTDSGALRTLVSSLTAAGATSADYGLEHAQSLLKGTDALTGARENAKKIVIFFTDGEPNHDSGFDATVANAAIAKAKTLKGDDTTIYTIGVFSDANPSDTSGRFNQYMHGVSSNYPDATKYTDLGDRAADDKSQPTQYYKAATNSDELNSIFNDISGELDTSGAGTPTQSTDGAEDTTGYITFTDQLGDYMQVDEFKSIVYNDKIYSLSSSEESKDETPAKVKYVFSADVPSNSSSSSTTTNLNNIEITVTKGSSLREGDTVEVKIPASLIPLREFNIDTDASGNTVMTVSEMYPIRIFYGVSLKNNAAAALSDPDNVDMQSYIADNTITDDDTGAKYVNFYSNKWKGNKDGDTTAVFTPASNNSFYYFAKDTPVYVDEACAQPAKQTDIDAAGADDMFYYKRTYFVEDSGNGSAEEKTIIRSFPAANFTVGSGNYDADENGNIFITPQAHRVSTINNMKGDKATPGGNTGTADTVINPKWTSDATGEDVSVALGNNGVLRAPLPGTLSVMKYAAVDENLDDAVIEDKTFPVSVSIPSVADKIFNAQVKDKSGTVQGSTFTVTFDPYGLYTHSLKDGETLVIYGLPNGASYSVFEPEASMPDGFVQTRSENVSGAIASGSTVEASFTNTYKVNALSLETPVTVSKTFNMWEPGSSFTFALSSTTSSDPLPEGATSGRATLTIDNTGDDAITGDGTKTASFGTITFTKPGEYTYSIWEVTPENADKVPGVSYSNVAYELRVVVADNGNGTLRIVSKNLYQVTDDEGKPLTVEELAEATPVNAASFTNKYDAGNATETIKITKNYTDNSGAKPLKNDTFSFRISPVENNDAPMPQGAKVDAAGVPYFDTSNIGNSVVFGIAYDTSDIHQTYTYKVTENISKDAVENEDGTYTLDGMTYDATEYFVVVSVEASVEAENAVVVPIATYYKGSVVAGNEVDSISFDNSYTPTPLTLGGNTAICGTKTLIGRNALDNETFVFTLKEVSAVTENNEPIENGVAIAKGGETAEVAGAVNGVAEGFSFGAVTFTKPGIYTFGVAEQAPANGNGMTYDGHTCTVTVTVDDEGGELKAASISYNNGTASNVVDQAEFANTYRAGGTTVDTDGTDANPMFVKVLTGRSWNEGESFSFSIAPASFNGASDEATLTGMPMPERETATVTKDTPKGAFGFGEIDFDQAGTYVYTVSEDIPANAAGNGITYASPVTLTVTVVDDGSGKLEATPSVTLFGVFQNEYNPGSVSLEGASNLKVVKEFTGDRDWADREEFNFVIEGVSYVSPDGVEDGANATVPLPSSGSTLFLDKPVTGGNIQTGAFGNIQFSKAGTYTYTIAEEPGNGFNVTYSQAKYQVVVTVTDTGTGSLAVSSVMTQLKDDAGEDVAPTAEVSEAKFVNSYERPDQSKTVEDANGQPADGKLVGVGDELTYTINWANDAIDEKGEAVEANVTVTDTVPTGTTLVAGSISPAGEYNEATRTITWNLGEQAANATGTVSFQVTVDDVENGTNDAIANQATVQVGDNDPKQTTKVTNYVPTKEETSKPTEINVGDTLTYKITFHNVDGEMGTITDELPQGLVYVAGSAKVTGATAAVGDPAVSGQTLTWTLADLQADTDVTVEFDATITRDALTTVDNQATVKIGDNEYDTNTDTTPVPTDNSKSVANDKGADVAGQYVAVGDKLTYTINWATEEAGTVTVVDTLPAGLAVDADDVDNGGVLDVDAAGNATITWTIADAVAGARGTVSFEATVTAAAIGEASGELTNRATVNDEPVSVTVKVPGTAMFDGAKNLSVTKTLEGRGWLAADSFTFDIAAKDDVTIAAVKAGEVTLPGPVTITGETNGHAASFGNIAFKKADTYTFTVSEKKGSIEGVTYDESQKTVVVEVTDDGQGALTAVLADSSDALVFKNTTNEPENTKDVSKNDESVNGGLVGVGDVLTYTINWVNDAADAATGNAVAATVTVTDTVPAGTTLVAGSAGDATVGDDGKLAWIINAAAGESGAVSFQVTVDDVADGTNSSITNQAKVQIDENEPKVTNTTEVTIPAKKVSLSSETDIKVGDELTYTISYKNTEADAATVTIVDALPAGLTFKEASNGGTFANGTITWSLENVGAGASGMVTFTATVNETAIDTSIENQAKVKIGENDPISTNTTTPDLKAKKGNLTISKNVKATEGLTAPEAQFTFMVKLKDAAGNVLMDAYKVNGVEQAATNGTLTLTLEAGQTAVIEGLPEGALYQVTEAQVAGFTQVADETSGAEGTIEADKTVAAAFVNLYDASMPADKYASTDGLFSKVLTGREWAEDDSFTFTIKPQDGAPAPVKATATVTKADLENGVAAFGFGTIGFTAADMKDAVKNDGGTYSKTFTYLVTENDIDATTMPNVAKDTHTAKLSITVTDDGKGTLTAAVPAASDGRFVNTYTSELSYDANGAGGLQLIKVLTGRNMLAEQFAFTIAPADDGGISAAKYAGGTVYVTAAEDGQASVMTPFASMKFTQDDAGKTFSYTVEETKVGGDGYENDTAVRTVAIAVTDDGKGAITATTTVTGPEGTQVFEGTKDKPAVAQVSFANSYAAEGDLGGDGEGAVSIEAAKTLTGRAMAKGEFKFVVTDKNGNKVATGENAQAAAIGEPSAITFDTINYTIDSLKEAVASGAATKTVDASGNATYSLQYTVSEVTDGLVNKGVSAVTTPITVTVNVTDNGDGTLAAAVQYPAGTNSLAFANEYDTADVSVALNASKSLVLDNDKLALTSADIAGKFTFTVTSDDPKTPLPKSATATNDAAGNVSFGDITYQLSDLGGAVSKTFTYQVTESGTLDGVTNDPNSVRTFTVTVSDNGDGTLSQVNSISDGLLAFTNSYKTTTEESSLTGEGNFTLTKTLDGRDMNAGEFAFELLDADQAVVATGVNDAAGNVVMSALTFEVPGIYQYTLHEVAGEAGNGVTYDDTVYNVTATVTDLKNGTLDVAWSVEGLDEDEKDIAFTNSYEPAMTLVQLGAAKVLEGRDLVEGEFAFELRDTEGNVIATASNLADGSAILADLEFYGVGEYHFTISEVNDGQANITYDDTVYGVTVAVEDDLKGHLLAKVIYDNGTPVFTNTYTEPPAPADANKPVVMPKTSDNVVLPAAIAAIAVAAAAVALVAVRRMKRR